VHCTWKTVGEGYSRMLVLHGKVPVQFEVEVHKITRFLCFRKSLAHSFVKIHELVTLLVHCGRCVAFELGQVIFIRIYHLKREEIDILFSISRKNF
jgi:hypothetical protein